MLTEIEKSVLAKSARMWLGSSSSSSSLAGDSMETPAHDGLIVPGGSIANLYSLLLARDRAEPTARNKGAGNNLVAFCSEQSHYSYRKNAMVAGMGMDNMIKVRCDGAGAMIVEELEREVREAVARGQRPIYVGCTAGSTVLGAFDPFDGCADVCARHGMWMHVDGAWGGAAALSPSQRQGHSPKHFLKLTF